ncbi:hypothetical protein [Fulvitalea axinellae]
MSGVRFERLMEKAERSLRTSEVAFISNENQSDFLDVGSIHTSGRISNILKTKQWKYDDQLSDEVFEADQALRSKYVLERVRSGHLDTYFGYPFIEGKLPDGTLLKTPLYLFEVDPISETEALGWNLYSGEGKLNPTIALLMPGVFLDIFNKEESPFRQIFEKPLIELDSRKSLGFAVRQAAGDYRIRPQAVVARFSFAEAGYVSDLRKIGLPMAETGAENKNGNAGRFRDFSPYAPDASGDKILTALTRGASVKVSGRNEADWEGLVAKTITDKLNRGMRVAFVSLDRMMRDSLTKRLSDLFPRRFIADLSAENLRKNETQRSMAESVEGLALYRRKSPDDLRDMRKEAEALSGKLNRIADILEGIRTAFNSSDDCGMPVQKLYLSSLPVNFPLDLRYIYRSFPLSGLADTKSRLGGHLALHCSLRQNAAPWLERNPNLELNETNIRQLYGILKEIPKIIEALPTATRNRITSLDDIDTCLRLLGKENYVREMLAYLANPATYSSFCFLRKSEPPKDAGKWLEEMEHRVMACYAEPGIELSLKTTELGAFVENIQVGLEAKWDPLQWLRWKQENRVRQSVLEMVDKNGLAFADGTDLMADMLDNRLNLEHNVSQIRSKPWFADIPGAVPETEMRQWFKARKNALRVNAIFRQLPEINASVDPLKMTYREFAKEIEDTLEGIRPLQKKREIWRQYLSEYQINRMLTDSAFRNELISGFEQHADTVLELDKSRSALDDAERKAVELLLESGQHDTETYLDIFDRNLRLAWIRHLERKYPKLKLLSSPELGDMLGEFSELYRQRKKLVKRMLPLGLDLRACRSVNFQNLNSSVAYSSLSKDIEERKTPLDKLVERHEEEVFQLLPCWVSSPEHLVSIAPPKKAVFDFLVIDKPEQLPETMLWSLRFRTKQILVLDRDRGLKELPTFFPKLSDYVLGNRKNSNNRNRKRLDFGTIPLRERMSESRGRIRLGRSSCPEDDLRRCLIDLLSKSVVVSVFLSEKAMDKAAKILGGLGGWKKDKLCIRQLGEKPLSKSKVLVLLDEDLNDSVQSNLLDDFSNYEVTVFAPHHLDIDFLSLKKETARENTGEEGLADRIHKEFGALENKIHLARDFGRDELCLKKNGKWLGIIQTDDSLFGDDDSHILESLFFRPAQIRKKRWAFRFVSSREYWLDPESIKERIALFAHTTESLLSN